MSIDYSLTKTDRIKLQSPIRRALKLPYILSLALVFGVTGLPVPLQRPSVRTEMGNGLRGTITTYRDFKILPIWRWGIGPSGHDLLRA